MRCREEWGNPAEEKYFEYMLSYSPLNNVTAQDYPSILITAGLNDPRVAYWEPAKWTATLRTHKTDSNPLLLKVCRLSQRNACAHPMELSIYLPRTAMQCSLWRVDPHVVTGRRLAAHAGGHGGWALQRQRPVQVPQGARLRTGFRV